ncbi:MAG: type II toxin-antitoxin system HicB family antitoxin [Chloroflexota bacterium]|nr:type II toxin-antitoxin system HicB family antitoxin [Chloroflexota bacterium]MDE2896263.1 type II toxin-antitoxin system HicB family antitoxin [Chloroflexota bacterium]
MRYEYPCSIERDLEELRASGREAYVITFRDIRGANSCGWSWPEALEMAEDCLDVALSWYLDDDADPPPPSPLQAGEVMVAATPIMAGKLAIRSAMREQDMTLSELAKRMDISDEKTRRLLDPRYRTHLTTVQRALSILGRVLIVEDCAVASPPESVAMAAET